MFDKVRRRPAPRCATGLAVIVLTLGSLLSGGCGHTENMTQEGVGNPDQQKKEEEPGEVKPEENSLAEWEEDLEEGEPGTFTAEAMRGASQRDWVDTPAPSNADL